MKSTKTCLNNTWTLADISASHFLSTNLPVFINLNPWSGQQLQRLYTKRFNHPQTPSLEHHGRLPSLYRTLAHYCPLCKLLVFQLVDLDVSTTEWSMLNSVDATHCTAICTSSMPPTDYDTTTPYSAFSGATTKSPAKYQGNCDYRAYYQPSLLKTPGRTLQLLQQNTPGAHSGCSPVQPPVYKHSKS